VEIIVEKSEWNRKMTQKESFLRLSVSICVKVGVVELCRGGGLETRKPKTTARAPEQKLTTSGGRNAIKLLPFSIHKILVVFMKKTLRLIVLFT
jgi:hypothetical protein